MLSATMCFLLSKFAVCRLGAGKTNVSGPAKENKNYTNQQIFQLQNAKRQTT